MLKKVHPTRRSMLRGFTVAGVATCVLFAQSAPASAFGHKKQLQELRQPAPTPAAPAQPQYTVAPLCYAPVVGMRMCLMFILVRLST